MPADYGLNLDLDPFGPHRLPLSYPEVSFWEITSALGSTARNRYRYATLTPKLRARRPASRRVGRKKAAALSSGGGNPEILLFDLVAAPATSSTRSLVDRAIL
jgi:hypothetical protein